MRSFSFVAAQFTGKERDAESCAAGMCLDNFGARFDASSLGRFMTPDWSVKPVTVAYANFGNPQSLNLYSYVENNPTTLRDPDGHVPWGYGGWGECDVSDAVCGRQRASNQANTATAAKAQSARSHPHPPHRPKSPKQVAGTIYNETSALRPTTDKGNGSPVNLSESRIAIAQVIEVNNSKEKFAPSAVHDDLRNPDAKDAWQDSLDAARNAANEQNGTNGATHIYLDAGQSTKPNWYNQGEIEESFGPFRVANNTKEFQAGEEVDIEIIVSPTPK